VLIRFINQLAVKPVRPCCFSEQLQFSWDDYWMDPGDVCLVVNENNDTIEFLSGNKVFWAHKNQEGEKYECLS
tara:strand:- start:304 stop:522 length:219 start_codon:yes stop_codon:yes gene_type:complete